ncbi:hypothetical protein [Sutcliffiella horikoshii]|nr:hypothetical protein [Sutcliffiella horikoshii]
MEICQSCKEHLVSQNTSPASLGEDMCQACYTEWVETIFKERRTE